MNVASSHHTPFGLTIQSIWQEHEPAATTAANCHIGCSNWWEPGEADNLLTAHPLLTTAERQLITPTALLTTSKPTPNRPNKHMLQVNR
jgi:hypothetical protein